MIEDHSMRSEGKVIPMESAKTTSRSMMAIRD